MGTLDRYVVRGFLYCYLLCFLVLMGLRTVTDLFINMDEFAELGLGWSELVRHVGSYYFFNSLVYFRELNGVILVAGAAFSLARMNRSNELTAILASGVSLYRVVMPVIVVGMALSGLSLINQELLIPQVKSRLVRDPDDVPGTKKFQVRLVNDGNRHVWWAPDFFVGDERMNKPLVILRDRQARYAGRLAGEQALYEGQGVWRFTDASLALVQPSQTAARTDLVRIANTPAQFLDAALPDGSIYARTGNIVVSAKGVDLQRQCLIEPRFEFLTEGADGIQPGVLATIVAERAQFAKEDPTKSNSADVYTLAGGSLFFQSDLTPNELELRQSSRWLDLLSTGDLNELLSGGKVADAAGANMARHGRFTEPLANLIMLMLGLPFILSRERNIKSSALLCLLMVGTCYISVFVSRYFGGYGLPPTIAAWLPILVFGPVAVLLLDAVKT